MQGSAHVAAVVEALAAANGGAAIALLDGEARNAAPVLLADCVLREFRLYAAHLERCEKADTDGPTYCEATALLVRLRDVYAQIQGIVKDIEGAGRSAERESWLPFDLKGEP